MRCEISNGIADVKDVGTIAAPKSVNSAELGKEKCAIPLIREKSRLYSA
jgi:hypothetical protein